MLNLLKKMTASLLLILCCGWAHAEQSKDIMQQSINKMLKLEMDSFYLYTTVEVYLDKLGLSGMAKWAKIQADEELQHFRRHITYAKNKGVDIKLLSTTSLKPNFTSPLQAFQSALAQEKKLGKFFDDLYQVSQEKHLITLSQHLTWYVNEQVEEVNLLTTVVSRMKIAGDNAGLILLDQELGKRSVK